MITIEMSMTSILVTVIPSIITLVVSSLITWYFSRRHYTRVLRPITEVDVALQFEKNDFYIKALRIVSHTVLIIFGTFGIYALMVIFI